MNTQFEKNKLYAYLGKQLTEAFKSHNAIVAGGTIASLFSNREINDIDVYFKDEDDLIAFLTDTWGSHCWIVSNTTKATQFLYRKDGKEVNVQLIHFQYFNKPEEIFTTFDYTACMGAYDFTSEEFILHPDFLKHNSQRILKFNSETAFPIVSLLRVQKYEGKGFTISKPEFIRVILTCMDLEINTYEELKEQLGGMYGINYDKLFEEIEEEEFNLKKAIELVADISLSDEYFIAPVPIEFGDIEEIIESISKKPIKIMTINGQLHKINHEGLLANLKQKPKNYIEINATEYFNNKRFYKFVKKVGDKYFSFYDDRFEYIIGETVEARKDRSSYGSNHSGNLHMSEKNDLDSNHMSRSGATLIELMVNIEDFTEASSHILAKKAFTVREVPNEEWEKFKMNDEDDLLFML